VSSDSPNQLVFQYKADDDPSIVFIEFLKNHRLISDIKSKVIADESNKWKRESNSFPKCEISKERIEEMRRAMEDIEKSGKLPYVNCLKLDMLPFLPVTIRLMDQRSLCLYVLMDTGCHSSRITRELLPPDLQDQKMIEAEIRIGGYNEFFIIFLHIIPSEKMPNHAKIMILGQIGFWDSVDLRYIGNPGIVNISSIDGHGLTERVENLIEYEIPTQY